MIPAAKLESLSRRFAEVEQLLCDPKTLSDPQSLTTLNRERAQLLPVVESFGKWTHLTKQIAEDKEALSDPELGPLAEQELPELAAQLEALEREIQIQLLPRDPNDERNTILEIRAGTGG